MLQLKRRPQYTLILSDETRLEQVGRWRLTRTRILLLALVALVAVTLAGFLIVYATPLHRLMPGYMKESQRAATEETLMRIDSLQYAYAQNEAYINNISAVLNTDRIPTDSAESSRQTNVLPPDSLLTASQAERQFVKAMQEREKFNVDVVAPLAAESVIFLPASAEGTVTESSRRQTVTRILTPAHSAVRAVAEGTVIAVDPVAEGYAVVVQHPKGFISRYAMLPAPMVSAGEKVEAGQAISLSPAPRGKTPPHITLQLWHNGDALVPCNYIPMQN